MLGYHLPASETPFKKRFAGGPLMARFKCYKDPLSHHHHYQKKRCRVGPPLAKLSESAHGQTFWIRACALTATTAMV